MHPDWAPTVAMELGHSSTTHSTNDGCLERYNRSKERTKKRRLDNTTSVDNIIQQSNDGNSVITPREQSENNEPDIDFANNSDEDQKLKKSIPVTNLVASEIQTDMTMVDIDLLTYRSTKNLSQDNFASEAFFQGDNEKVKFYTGLPGLAVVMVLFELIKPGLVVRNSLTKFQQFSLTLMRLRLNLSVQDLAYRFGVHASTVSRVFHNCINVMYSSMNFLIYWPTRQELNLTRPMCFRGKFSSCSVILDCFEVFIDRPSDLLARAQTWSSYKSHNTAKFLIGVTPQGTVSFISNAWGGRVSDKYITEHCGLLQKLLPGDMVLADRGFDIEDSCGLYCATLRIPCFTKGKPQLSPVDVEATRSIANVRIHVERVIGCVRQKYTILGHGIAPIDYLKSDNGEPCLLDKIALVSCALVNCCKSVVSVE
jgi:DNA-binding transcriptional regulator YiaG